jgi:nucleoside-diphosphate-sugar epimerase
MMPSGLKRRALVTGGTGFVGSNLARALIKRGWRVDVIVRQSSNLKMLSDFENSIAIHRFKGGMDQMMEIISSASPDVVFHIASMVIGEHRFAQVEGLISSNILLGSQLLEALCLNGGAKFINTGTYWEHFENKEYSPVNLYAATKYAFQNILQYYVEARDIKAITLKLFDPYGPNDPRPKLLNLLMKIAETGESLAMSPGEQKIDLVHIDDVVRAYEIAAKRLLDNKVEGHEIYGIASGKPITLKMLVSIIEKETMKKINIEWGGRPYRHREVMDPMDKLNSLPGWYPKISHKAGVKSLFTLSQC